MLLFKPPIDVHVHANLILRNVKFLEEKLMAYRSERMNSSFDHNPASLYLQNYQSGLFVSDESRQRFYPSVSNGIEADVEICYASLWW